MITIEQIPPLSTVALRVMRFDIEDPEAGSYALEQLIKPDKGISSKLLKIGNSALYGRSGKIKTLKDAITLLGVKTTKNLIVMLILQNMNNTLKIPIYKKFLQEKPVLTALVVLDLCGILGLNRIKETAFLMSLLVRIGMSIFALNYPDRYCNVLAYYGVGKVRLIALEQNYYQTDSLQVGIMVFDHWKLPAEYKETIEHLEFETDKIQNLSDLSRVVILADNISSKLMHIPLMENDIERNNKILEFYRKPTSELELFDEDYFEFLKDHPFYEQTIMG
ncbi:MAG: HDOD domain-containing protein [Leptospiraceae bacterium]|nr:HDOD domain-containing protein [Leptospiraceae bacterium]